MEQQETEFGSAMSGPKDYRELLRWTCDEQTPGVRRALIDYRRPIRPDLNREQQLFRKRILRTPCSTLVRC